MPTGGVDLTTAGAFLKAGACCLGIGSQLVKFALEEIKSSGSSLVPMCQFVAAYVQRHREYAELVAPAHRAL